MEVMALRWFPYDQRLGHFSLRCYAYEWLKMLNFKEVLRAVYEQYSQFVEAGRFFQFVVMSGQSLRKDL